MFELQNGQKLPRQHRYARPFDKLRAGSCKKRKDRAPSSPTSGRHSNRINAHRFF